MLAVLLFSGCADLKPITVSPPGSLGASMPHALIIERPLTVGRTDHYSYPAGRYVAKFTDRDGTYYASPIGIERRFLLPLTEARTGGFYAPFRNSFHLKPYDVDSEENIGFHGLVSGLQYHYEDQTS